MGRVTRYRVRLLCCIAVAFLAAGCGDTGEGADAEREPSTPLAPLAPGALPPVPGPATGDVTAATAGSAVIVVGGYTSREDGSRPLGTVDLFSSASPQWRRLKTGGPKVFPSINIAVTGSPDSADFVVVGTPCDVSQREWFADEAHSDIDPCGDQEVAAFRVDGATGRVSQLDAPGDLPPDAELGPWLTSALGAQGDDHFFRFVRNRSSEVRAVNVDSGEWRAIEEPPSASVGAIYCLVDGMLTVLSDGDHSGDTAESAAGGGHAPSANEAELTLATLDPETDDWTETQPSLGQAQSAPGQRACNNGTLLLAAPGADRSTRQLYTINADGSATTLPALPAPYSTTEQPIGTSPRLDIWPSPSDAFYRLTENQQSWVPVNKPFNGIPINYGSEQLLVWSQPVGPDSPPFEIVALDP